MKVLVTGGRKYSSLGAVRVQLEAIADMRAEPHELIHGACDGADMLADRVARQLGWKVTPYPADWRRHGDAAGPIRNSAMIAANPDIELCIAFPGHKGTADCVRKARAAGIAVREVPR